MGADIDPPTRRRCTECGRVDVWDDEAENWVIAEDDGQRRVGDKHCIHVWDVEGRHNPVDRENVDA